MKLVCVDGTFSNWYGFAVAVLFLPFDFILIFMPYPAGAVPSITSQREHLRALNNCLSHILALLILAVLSMVPWYGKRVSPPILITMDNVCHAEPHHLQHETQADAQALPLGGSAA